jgi:hypothetical protein
VGDATGIHDIPCKIEEFTVWVERFPKKMRQTIAVGVSAVFWTLWKARNAANFHHVFTRMTLVYYSSKFLIGCPIELVYKKEKDNGCCGIDVVC